MYYRILSADENVRADESLVKSDTDTGITLVSRDTLPASGDGLQNKIVFDADGTLYRYDICGKPQIIGKTQKSINSIFRSQCRRTSAINEQSSCRTLLVTIQLYRLTYFARLFERFLPSSGLLRKLAHNSAFADWSVRTTGGATKKLSLNNQMYY